MKAGKVQMDQIPNQTRNHTQRRMYSLHPSINQSYLLHHFCYITISEKSVLSSVTVSFKKKNQLETAFCNSINTFVPDVCVFDWVTAAAGFPNTSGAVSLCF